MAYHTYEFLRARRRDPKWRERYQVERLKRIAIFLTGILFFEMLLILYQSNVDVSTWCHELSMKVTHFFR
jgi:hypothetical protein